MVECRGVRKWDIGRALYKPMSNHHTWVKVKVKKSHAYGRHWISRPMQGVEPIPLLFFFIFFYPKFLFCWGFQTKILGLSMTNFFQLIFFYENQLFCNKSFLMTNIFFMIFFFALFFYNKLFSLQNFGSYQHVCSWQIFLHGKIGNKKNYGDFFL